MLDRSAVLRRTDDHVSAPLEDSLVMMDIDAGKYYMLDGVASVIWSQLAAPTPVARLVDELCSQYEVSSARCEADILPFLTELHDKGLVERA